jgi:hypothetical protein
MMIVWCWDTGPEAQFSVDDALEPEQDPQVHIVYGCAVLQTR